MAELKLTLKKDNFPQVPGDYICQRYPEEIPQFARVTADPALEGELTVESYHSKFTVADCEPHTLFSDRLTVAPPAFEGAKPE